MSHAISAPLSLDGQTVAVAAGPVVVAVQRINPCAYRLAVRCGSAGGEVPALCRWFPSEGQARHAARVATALFRAGWTVERVLDLVAVFTPAGAGE